VSWPAVPYSSINGDGLDDGDSRPPSPPTFAFNGISTEPPKQFVRQKEDPSVISSETLARQKALQEENSLYPPLVAPNIIAVKRHDSSPIIPLSPDPFGRFPSDGEASQMTRDSYYGEDALGSLPERGSVLGVPATTLDEFRPPSQTPSSRFSLDSVTSEDVVKATPGAAAKATTPGPLSGVRSIRRLWRRSESKRASVTSVAQSPSGRTSPNTAAVPTQAIQPGRARGKSISKTPSTTPPPVTEAPNVLQVPIVPSRESSREPPMRVLRFDQESPYPIHPVRTSSVRSPSPPPVSRPASQQAHYGSSDTPQVPASAPPEKNSVRKSILKSWKSASGLSTKNGSASSTPRSSTEQLPETAKKRRPSVVELASGVLRGNPGSGQLSEIPPSPALPEQFATQMRSSSRQSQSNGRPSVSSSGSASSPPRMRSPLNPMGSPPRPGLTAHSRTSVESYESRPSFDVSQFEMVSPPHSALSYPYHGLDAAVSSHD
jgi:hypothetical protein